MNITIQTVGFKESKHLVKFIYQKVERLFQHHPETIRVDITLKKGAKNNVTNEWCALYLSHPGENQYVKHHSETYEESITHCVESMEKILRRQKSIELKLRKESK
ncbi:MAG: HPF/RaiA family ribosome-associated protein [Saprospiraceae bacterium]